MSCYLLTWKPDRWSKDNFENYYSQYQKGEILRWSCGSTKRIITGDSFFLLRQGKGQGPTGIIGFGIVVQPPYSAPHYIEERAKKGDEALYVDVRFDFLAHPNAKIPIKREKLTANGISESFLNAQGSGNEIHKEVEAKLTDLWASFISPREIVYADEIDSENVTEGAKKVVSVNSYERNPKARQKCIDKWGYNCSVCGFHFELFYGAIGKEYIHVHHLKPISTIGKEYVIDPEKDLRPVCPNCHAMLHKRNPPYSIEELRALVSTYGTRLS